MQQDEKLTPETFRRLLREQLEAICKERQWSFDNNKNRGTAFQLWSADLLIRAYRGVDITTPDDAVVETGDLLADVVLEDTVNERLIIAQCRCQSLQSQPQPLEEDRAAAFFARHKHYMDREWIKKHGSQQAFELLGDYAERVNRGWVIIFLYIGTGQTTERIDDVVEKQNQEYADNNTSVSCTVLDRSRLKEFYNRTVSLEGQVGIVVDQALQRGMYFVRSDPYPTLVAAVKANWLRNIYQQAGVRERIFALNIRDWLGRRTGINKDIVKTATKEPENFFYYNNGVSAVCTSLEIDQEHHRVRAADFQIINGAQTIGAIVDAAPNESAYVLLRITESAKSKSKAINDNIIKFNNTQNVIKVSDFCANDQIQLWLEEHLRDHKARPHVPQITYQRRRGVSNRAAKGSFLLRLEDLGKIRYAFEHEPTRVINSPKDLFTRRSIHSEGLYERAFGVDEHLEPMWTQTILNRALLAIAAYLAVSAKVDEKRKDEAMSFLNQLKFHLLSLFGEVCRKKWDADRVKELVTNEKQFGREFTDFWKCGLTVIRSEWKRNDADPNGMTLRTFARSGEVWGRVKDAFWDFYSSNEE